MKKVLFLFLAGMSFAAAAGELVFIGRGDKNIHVARLDLQTGALSGVREAAQVFAPSFLAIAPNHHFLYAISEGSAISNSALSAFALGKDGALTFLNRQSAVGSGPCHVSVDPRGQCAFLANYNSGSMTVYPLQTDGSLAAPSTFIQNHGSSVVRERQQGPHAHCAETDLAGRYVFDCDLGLDQVLIYKLDAAHGTLTPNDPPFFAAHPGSGPRHLAFHPNGHFAYLISEMAATVTALTYDPEKGRLAEIQTESLTPEDYKGWRSGAEVAVHPTGRWVYASHRGDNTITVFACDVATGRLTVVERKSSGGKIPRDFEIDTTGAFLLAANQDSGLIVVFRIDPATGRLQETGQTLAIPMPMCLKCLADE
ncbi:MAG TPA: lactonase family protein [Verrucomicrobiae bacterium]|jgi:6-phosphogluconolactonase|nr:lactonase family protein [Verrucomicrobiae bacterium]